MRSKSKSKKKRHREEEDDQDSTSSSSSSSYSSESDNNSIERSSKRQKSSHKRSDNEKRRREKRRREKEKEREKRHNRRKEKRKHTSKKSKRNSKKRYSDSDSDSYSGSESEDSGRDNPEEVVKHILQEFPGVSNDLEQLLQMIDDGQAVDINGLSEKSLINHLRKLFLALKLKENGDKVFLLPPKMLPTLPIIQPIIRSLEQSQNPVPHNDINEELTDTIPSPIKDYAPAPPPIRKRPIGPEMPSAELLAAAAKLTEAEAQLREAEMEEDGEYFIGPPPPAVVKEAQSSNEAERFEEVTRIMGAEVDIPYDILGVNNNMSDDNMKKRYWKLSLMVHPDKCSHPEANQAFIKLNKAFKDLKDVDKRKAMDEKIKQKEEEAKFKVELKAMREAAQWRRLQGISMEGDDILLAEMNAEVGPKRDEWMTNLPPERKPGGMPTHSKTFNKGTKEGRGDTSAWTDTPNDRAQKAKINYLEAYNEAAALASKEVEIQKGQSEAKLVDEYNKVKRSKTLVEQHKESTKNRIKKNKLKKKNENENEGDEWEGNHPWKPWDREKDLTAGRQNVKFDSKSMTQGLTSRFSSGSYQRNFL